MPLNGAVVSIAVEPASISLDQVSQVVGRAWEGTGDVGLTRVNTVVGLDRSDVLTEIIARQQEALDALRILVEQNLQLGADASHAGVQ